MFNIFALQKYVYDICWLEPFKYFNVDEDIFVCGFPMKEFADFKIIGKCVKGTEFAE